MKEFIIFVLFLLWISEFEKVNKLQSENANLKQQIEKLNKRP